MDFTNDIIENMGDMENNVNYEPMLPEYAVPNASAIDGIEHIPSIAADFLEHPQYSDPMNVDIMSGIPSCEFQGNSPISKDTGSDPSFLGTEIESYDEIRLHKSEEIEAIRDAAVEHYKDAKASGNIEEMLKWEAEANKQQGRLYDHWGTPTYGIPPKAPGIN